jgi:hypothetical protein
MWMSGLKAVLMFLVVSLIGIGAAVGICSAWAGEEPAKKTPPVPPEAQNGEKLEALLKERRAFAKRKFDDWKKAAFSERANADMGGFERKGGRKIGPDIDIRLYALRAEDQLYQWAQRLLTAELELSDKKADRVAACEAHLLRMKEVEDFFKKCAKKDEAYAGEAVFHRLDAEIMLERTKAN